METILTRNKIHFVDYTNFLEFVFDDSAFDQAPAVKVRTDGEKLIIVEGWFKDGAFEAREAAAYPLDKVAEPLSLTMSEYDALIDGSYYGLDRLNEFNETPDEYAGRLSLINVGGR